MSGYLIADVTAINDPELYKGYQPLVPPSLRAFNGTYLARGGNVTYICHADKTLATGLGNESRLAAAHRSDDLRQ